MKDRVFIAFIAGILAIAHVAVAADAPLPLGGYAVAVSGPQAGEPGISDGLLLSIGFWGCC